MVSIQLVFGVIETLFTKCNMKYVYLFICFFMLGCLDKSHQAYKDKQSEIINLSAKNEYDSIRLQWNNLADSMIILGRRHFSNDYHIQTLLRDGISLNKEDLVYQTIRPLCELGDTIFFIIKFDTSTKRGATSFWKYQGSYEMDLYNMYHYTRVSIIKNASPFNVETLDSVKIYHDYDLEPPYSKAFINACNRWDTLALQQDNSMDRTMRETAHRFVYRVILTPSGNYEIKCTSVIRQVCADEQISEPSYSIIW